MCRRAAATNEADPRLEPTLFSMPQVAPPSNSPRWRHLLVSPKHRHLPTLPKSRHLPILPKSRHLPTPRNTAPSTPPNAAPPRLPQMPSLFMKIRRRSRPGTAPRPAFLHDVGRGGKVGRREWDGERGTRKGGRGMRDEESGTGKAGRGKRDEGSETGRSSMKGPRLPGEARAPFL